MVSSSTSTPRIWLKLVSVEPVMLLSMAAATLLDLGNRHMYIQKACRNDTTFEPTNISSPCDDKSRGDNFLSGVVNKVNAVKMFLVLLLLALCASWSDRAGRKRKFFIVMSLVGLVLECVLQYLHSYYWSWPPVSAAITTAAVQVLFGHPHSSMSAFGFMYLFDVVDTPDRTMRLGIFSTMKMLGMLVGRGASGFLLTTAGFCKFYASCFGLSVVAVVLAYFYIEDTSVPAKNVVSYGSLFDFRHIIKSFKVIFGNRSQKHRILTVLLMLTYTLLLFIHEGKYFNSILFILNWKKK